jgi:hypothetical protein
MSFTYLRDWMVRVITNNAPVSSPHEFLCEFECDMALVQSNLEANRTR